MTDTANTGLESSSLVATATAHAAKTWVPGPAQPHGGNTSYLSNAAYFKQNNPGLSPRDVRHGWHPNLA